MAAPSYSEDLTDLNLAESETGWVELTGTIGGNAYDRQGPLAGGDPDYPFIQGSFSVTQDCTKNTSVGSMAYNNGAGTGGHGTDGAYFVWQNYMVASNIGTYAQGGFQVCVGSSTANYDVWYVGGVDKSPYPYGGWVNHAVNTTVTPDGTAGTPTATEQYIGAAVFVVTGSSKGEVHNVDVIRYGRGSAIFEFGDLANGYATFAGFAALNDNNNNRWGLISETSGGYLWKGRMALGTATNAVDFRDSDVTIFIQWTPKVTANFNLIEVVNASSNVQWNNVNIVCTDTTTASRGRFLMTDNATVVLTGCNFTDMDTFTFLSNATLDTVTFNSANAITTGGATISSCTFNNIVAMTITSAITGSVFRDSMRVDITASSASLTDCQIRRTSDATSMVRLDASVASLTRVDFIGEATNKHAVELTGLPAGGTLTWTHTQDSNFATGSTGVEGTDFTATSNGDEALYINVASSSPITISVDAGATTPSIRRGASYTGTITVTGQQKTIDVNVKDENGSPISGAQVWIDDGVTTIFNGTTDINGDITQQTYGGTNNSTLRVRKYGYQPFETTLGTATGNVSQLVTALTDDQQQDTPPTPVSTWTINTTLSTITMTSGATLPHTSYATLDTVKDLYQYVMNIFAGSSFMQFEVPFESITATQYAFINGWTFGAKDNDYKFLYDGSIVDTANVLQWSNVRTIGSLETGTNIYIVQGVEASDAALTSWWPAGNLNVLVKTRDTTWLQSTDDTATNINGGLWLFAREYGNLYDHFFVDAAPQGQNIVALSTSNDLNNQTASGTVAGYTDITVTIGATSQDIGDGNGNQPYNALINCNGRPLSEVYEYLKYITRRGADSTALLGTTDNGYEYRNASESTFSNVDNKQAPFGTFAGGRFFGAYGVFITNMASSDNTNYQLTDSNGVLRFPPSTVSFSLTGLKDGTEVRIYQTSDSTEVAGVEDMTGGTGTGINSGTGSASVTGTTDNNTFTYTYTYSSDIPVFVAIVNLEYQNILLENQTLTNTNQSIPIAQIIDRQYDAGSI